MPEPLTTFTASAIGAYLAKDGVQKLLGPTAEYLGHGMQDFVQKRFQNVQRIFEAAEEKLGDKIETKGQVPPRVLKAIINEGSYSEDSISVEYFGGILASSRSEIGRDDRGYSVAKILDGLSAYQIRAHYLIYSAFFRNFSGTELNWFISRNLENLKFYIPFSGFLSAMEFNEIEAQNLREIIPHILFGLTKNDLISSTVKWGDVKTLENPPIEEDGICLRASIVGIELFLWGMGQGGLLGKETLKEKLIDKHLDDNILAILRSQKY